MNNESQDLSKQKIAIKLFFYIMKEWNVDEPAQYILLGNPSMDSFHYWQEPHDFIELPQDTLLRISYCVNIYKILHTIFTNKVQANAWVSKINITFQKKTALDRMISGDINSLKEINQYLSSQLT
ncbi:MAG: DUF2384 domain-containing protein [Thalassotalea sp.]